MNLHLGVKLHDLIYAPARLHSSGLDSVLNDLETKRIVRLSTMSFPKYFALVARAKANIASVGPEGGTVAQECNHGTIEAAFPENALRKKIKGVITILY
jgi:hypothetical protein